MGALRFGCGSTALRCVAGFQTRNSCRISRRLGSRRYSRFGNLRYTLKCFGGIGDGRTFLEFRPLRQPTSHPDEGARREEDRFNRAPVLRCEPGMAAPTRPPTRCAAQPRSRQARAIHLGPGGILYPPTLLEACPARRQSKERASRFIDRVASGFRRLPGASDIHGHWCESSGPPELFRNSPI
jgi:hypothetical protein